MFLSGFQQYMWRRLVTVSAEDCWGILTAEIKALATSWHDAHKKTKGSGRIFAAKAIILLCQAKKSRDADHLTNLVYDKKLISDDVLESELNEARKTVEEIPDYALDVHTTRGRLKGRSKTDFFLEEHDALSPKQIGLFDADLENLRNRKTSL